MVRLSGAVFDGWKHFRHSSPILRLRRRRRRRRRRTAVVDAK
jgi:hypothetical protein